jgi:NAD kinase
MGSLGFLTAFEEDSIPKAIDDVVNGDFFFTQRRGAVQVEFQLTHGLKAPPGFNP